MLGSDFSEATGIPFGERPGRRFGEGDGQRFGQPDGDDVPRQYATALGSGFFISADGYAVTNNHVVDGAARVEVTTDDGKSYTARVVGTDPRSDLALIKVDSRNDFPFAHLADRRPRVGEWVLAVGNPFGLGGTVTAGIVSANGRSIGNGRNDNYIQIDAPVNKGNSGGPTFDMDGNVIGVDTAIFSPSGGNVGIAFDIPADTVKSGESRMRNARGALWSPSRKPAVRPRGQGSGLAMSLSRWPELWCCSRGDGQVTKPRPRLSLVQNESAPTTGALPNFIRSGP
jgi:S1-C subfamily serine protease